MTGQDSDFLPTGKFAPLNQAKTGKVKLETGKKRRKVFKKLLEHLREGYPISCFPDLDKKTIFTYLDKFPDDFPADQYERARREGHLAWEKIGKKGTIGDLPKFNPKSWQFKMMNSFGYSIKQETLTETTLIFDPIDLDGVPDDELEERAAKLRAKLIADRDGEA